MTIEQFANNSTTTLNGSISNSISTLVVTNTSSFPSVPQFRIIIENEIMIVTGVSGTTFTVTRGAENTTATIHSSGVDVFLIFTAGAIDQLRSDFLSIETIGHRLTLTSNTPVTTTDIIGANTLYLTPHNSNRLPLFDGYIWRQYAVSEISLSLNIVSGKNYDVFAYNNSSTITLELSSAWANDTVRTDAIARQDGVLVKSSDPVRRYIGTIRASGTNTTEDSISKRYVWNYYNKNLRKLKVLEATDSWTYSSSGFRQANGSSLNKVEYVVGDISVLIEASVNCQAQTTASGAGCGVGIGVDSTSTNSADFGYGSAPGTGAWWTQIASYSGYPGLGYHSVVWLEQAVNGSTTTFYGDNGNNTFAQSGMMGILLG